MLEVFKFQVGFAAPKFTQIKAVVQRRLADKGPYSALCCYHLFAYVYHHSINGAVALARNCCDGSLGSFIFLESFVVT